MLTNTELRAKACLSQWANLHVALLSVVIVKVLLNPIEKDNFKL